MARKKKPKIEAHIDCPECDAHLIIRVNDEIIKPAVKAEKKQIVEVETDKQTTLETVTKKKKIKGGV